MESIRKKQMDSTTAINNRAFDIGKLAHKAMLYEVSCFPSPGLVSPVSQGAHKDMNYFTFIDSAAAIYKYLLMFSSSGFSKCTPKQIFDNIRKIGMQCEAEMLRETKGINTHKGMIFLMGTCCAAFGKAIYEGLDFCEVNAVIQAMTEGICERELEQRLNGREEVPQVEELSLAKELSHGEKLYLKHGFKGIRGEIEKGLPIIFQYSLAHYKSMEALEIEERLIRTLIGIMQYCEDSTIVYRHSLEVLQEVQNKAKNISTLDSEAFKMAVLALDKEFIARNISPGGSADLLSITVFVCLMEKYMGGMNC